MERTPRVLAIDAGGTMTDTIIIDERGDFVVGKARTTPEDESVAFTASCADALRGRGAAALEAAFPRVVSGVYSGTAMINRLITRKGRRLGLMVTAGQEDCLRLERGVQTYLGYSYSDRLHVATHVHNEPLVPAGRIRGVRGRIDYAGREVIPLYEDEVERAAAELAALGVEALCICFLHSYRNPMHERAAKDVAQRITGGNVPVFTSSELCPIRGDTARLNTLLVEAYAADPSRVQLEKIRAETRRRGARFDLRVMSSHGGTISIDSKELARTLVSGPIGGVVGARHLAAALGKKNVVCADIGGTSFDIALITGGEYHVKPNPDVARFLLAIPLVQVDSIGAGTGSFVRVNPSNNRVEIGPDSAGSRIGMCWRGGGLDVPTITDCHVVLGHINPDYFLGGEIKLDVDRAHAAIADRVAKPLGLDVHAAAEGVIEILEDNLRSRLLAAVVGRGYSPVSYTLISYGGGGPVHVGGFTLGVPFEDVLIPSWAAGFSAYGCACADYEYRFDRSVDFPLNPGATGNDKMTAAFLINAVWDELKRKVAAEFAKSGFAENEISFRPYLRMQYLGQLNDLELRSPVDAISSPGDVDLIVRAFEDLYGRVYTLAAKSPELGFLFTTAVMAGGVEVEKPALPVREPGGAEPPAEARKKQRPTWWNGGWLETAVFEMDRLRPGNVIAGPAIVESPATTLAVPPGRTVRLDEHLIFHMNAASCPTFV
ncbi:MAG: hydantoinase/oxoprolinase family protein [bacterium]